MARYYEVTRMEEATAKCGGRECLGRKVVRASLLCWSEILWLAFSTELHLNAKTDIESLPSFLHETCGSGIAQAPSLSCSNGSSCTITAEASIFPKSLSVSSRSFIYWRLLNMLRLDEAARQCTLFLENTCFGGTIPTLTNYNDGLARWNMDSPRKCEHFEGLCKGSKTCSPWN